MHFHFTWEKGEIAINIFAGYLSRIKNLEHRTRLEEVLRWIPERFPTLTPRLAWNQPMFTDHGTFIIGFSVAKFHMSIAPEDPAMLKFAGEFTQAGYDYSKKLVRIKWVDPVDFGLLERIIQFNMDDKADCTTFWRKS